MEVERWEVERWEVESGNMESGKVACCIIKQRGRLVFSALVVICDD